MKLIDENLGGTTPLEIILKFPKTNDLQLEEEDEDWGTNDGDNAKYWFTKDKIENYQGARISGKFRTCRKSTVFSLYSSKLLKV